MTRLQMSSIAFAALAALAVSGTDDKPLPAFPGAEGFGAVAKGGRGGRVIKVTNLQADGPGSLQAACREKGPRIIVFDVSGVIEGDVLIEHGEVSILGQTAPGAGITIAGSLKTRYRAGRADRRPRDPLPARPPAQRRRRLRRRRPALREQARHPRPRLRAPGRRTRRSTSTARRT